MIEGIVLPDAEPLVAEPQFTVSAYAGAHQYHWQAGILEGKIREAQHVCRQYHLGLFMQEVDDALDAWDQGRILAALMSAAYELGVMHQMIVG